MPTTYPNQKVVVIHREPLGGSFLGINNDNWKDAARVLGAQAFLLYIYFAANKSDYIFALSPKAIQQEIGMPPSTYRDQFRKLESLGYIAQGDGNKLHFYEVPQRATRYQNARVPLNSSEEKRAGAVQASTAPAYQRTPENIEIYINNKQDLINTPEENGNVDRIGIVNPRDKGFHF